jgi:hypothetical protein
VSGCGHRAIETSSLLPVAMCPSFDKRGDARLGNPHGAGELVAAGADLVAGHSAHVFHRIGAVDGRLALYDLGGALDDYAVDRKLRNDLGILALWHPRTDAELELVGLELRFCETRLAYGPAADWIATRLERACAPLGTKPERVSEQHFAVPCVRGLNVCGHPGTMSRWWRV